MIPFNDLVLYFAIGAVIFCFTLFELMIFKPKWFQDKLNDEAQQSSTKAENLLVNSCPHCGKVIEDGFEMTDHIYNEHILPEQEVQQNSTKVGNS